jgi:ankyrin repeat protein
MYLSIISTLSLYTSYLFKYMINMKILLSFLILFSTQSMAKLDWTDIRLEHINHQLLSKASKHPLHRIVRQSQDVDVIQALLDRGYDINTLDHLDRPVLVIASRYAKGSVLIQYLLDSGADPLAQDKWGNTALHRLVQYNPDPEVIQFFLNEGLDPAQENIFNKTPRSIAKMFNPSILPLLY